MGLETGSKISDLNEANPLGTDAKSQGDDHIRLIKSTLKLDVFAASLASTSADKATPVNADLFLIADSAASFVRKKLSWANLKATLNAAIAGHVTGAGLTMSTARLLGRTTAATGVIEEIAIGTGLSLSAGTLEATAPPSFPSGTLMLFQQTTAPTGWTKQTTHNDKALRVVSGTVSSGGNSAFSSVFSRTASDAFTLTATYIPSHTHTHKGRTMSEGGYTAPYANVLLHPPEASEPTDIVSASSTDAGTGGGSAHSHGMDIRVQYVDLIIAAKDA